jgi:hypothetical protein
MHQDDINKDLDHYIHDRKKDKPFWSKIVGKDSKPKEVQEELKHDVERMAEEEDLAPEDKKELEGMEEKLEEVNEVEEQVGETIAHEKEGLLRKFFKKLRSSRRKASEDEDSDDDSDDSEDESVSSGKDAHESSEDVDIREFLRTMHNWITQLPPETLKEFKNSQDFELYTKMLKKYNLIK